MRTINRPSILPVTTEPIVVTGVASFYRKENIVIILLLSILQLMLFSM